jgi:hypothetical protein
MSGKDIKRGFDLKKLFDSQERKVDHRKDHKGRKQDQAKLMDKVAGKEWRGEAKMPEIEVIELNLTGGKPAEDPGSFYDRVHGAMYEEGHDYKDDEEDTAEDTEKRQCGDKRQIMDQIMELVKKLAT